MIKSKKKQQEAKQIFGISIYKICEIINWIILSKGIIDIEFSRLIV